MYDAFLRDVNGSVGLNVAANFEKTREMYNFCVDLMSEGNVTFSNEIPIPVSPCVT